MKTKRFGKGEVRWSYRGEAFEGGEAVFLRGGRFLESFVFLNERLNFVETVTIVLTLQVRFVRDEPRLRNGCVARKLVDFQDCSENTTEMKIKICILRE